MRVLLLFIDGLGIGERDLENNPLARFQSRHLGIFKNAARLPSPNDGRIVPTRVDMDVPGLPQSATGQTALFTGRNAAAMAGRHVPAFPTAPLRLMLDEASLFKSVAAMGKKGVFANALSQQYFERRGERVSASTRALLAGGFPWLTMEDLRDGRAVSHDLTNQFLRDMGEEVPLRTPAASAHILAEVSRQADFTLFEFFLTDMAGHSRNLDDAKTVVERLDTLLETILAHTDLRQTVVVLTSDHGNFEDFSVKTHTLNLVPTCFWGLPQDLALPDMLRIEEIASRLLEFLTL